MQINDLIPWNRERKDVAQSQGESSNPLQSLQRDINRVFEDFWTRFEGSTPFGRSAPAASGFLSVADPRADVSESEDAVEVSVELPGMTEKDIDVSLSDDAVTIRGEKKSEREDRKSGYYLAERSYGSFYRRIPLPPGIDSEKAEATFKNGVLSVTLPKTAEAQEKVRKIEVKGA